MRLRSRSSAELIFLCLVQITPVDAQEYGRFKLGLGAGYAGGSDATDVAGGGGLLLTLEPAYRVSDNLAIGLRLEGAAYGSTFSGWPGAFGSITINGQYYFSAEQFRPFVGAGLGIYSEYEREFGFYPRVGFDWRHFTMALEFNFIPAGSSNYDYLSSTSSTSSAYYIGVRVGGFFFGGRNDPGQ
jgi:hypothetical protein